MPDTTSGDTKEKMMIKDHDVLVALFTKVDDFTRRYDEDKRADAETSKNLAVELRSISLEQVRNATEIANIKKDNEARDRRQDRLETKSVNMDVIGYVLAAIAAVIAWFKT